MQMKQFFYLYTNKNKSEHCSNGLRGEFLFKYLPTLSILSLPNKLLIKPNIFIFKSDTLNL